MAPRAPARRSVAQQEAIYDLGVRGRKTGVFLKDNGERDEHGMQPLDDIFSSPEKDVPRGGKENRNAAQNDDEDDDEDDESAEEEPMDIDDITAPAPTAFMNGTRLPIPRARSPPKTYLQSPPMKNRHLGPSSSPARGSIVSPEKQQVGKGEAVKRKLDFNKNALANKPNLSASKANGGRTNGFANGHHSSADEEEDDDDDDAILRGRNDPGAADTEEESMAMLDAGGDDYAIDDEEEEEPEAEPEESIVEEEPAPKAAAKSRGRRPQKAPVVEQEEPEAEAEESVVEEEVAPRAQAAKSRGRPKKAPVIEEEEEPEEEVADQDEPLPSVEEPVRAGKKRGRPAKNNETQDDDDAIVDEQPQPPTKRRKPQKASSGDEQDAAQPKPKGRKSGRPKAADISGESSAATSSKAPVLKDPKTGKKLAPKRRPSDMADVSLAEVPRGPPPPKSRGLMIVRREALGEGAGTRTTRAGRSSYKPLAFWKNERTEFDDGEVLDDGKNHILLPGIKEIVRVDEPEVEHKTKRRGRPGVGKKGKRKSHDYDSEDEEDLEPWEVDPGRIVGEVILWNPEHDSNPPAPDDPIEVMEEQLAMSASAIVTRPIRNASFKFAKTLSLPFFGAGVVELPPGAEKRTKNSRKMHMAFFVFTGRVLVTLGDTEFRIGKGGMWNVPRGNYYSIHNDYDQDAKIFFAQGCEISADAGVGEASQMAS